MSPGQYSNHLAARERPVLADRAAERVFHDDRAVQVLTRIGDLPE